MMHSCQVLFFFVLTTNTTYSANFMFTHLQIVMFGSVHCRGYTLRPSLQDCLVHQKGVLQGNFYCWRQAGSFLKRTIVDCSLYICISLHFSALEWTIVSRRRESMPRIELSPRSLPFGFHLYSEKTPLVSS